MTEARGTQEPGWYADPSGTYSKRYWDGRAWTDQVELPNGTVGPDPPLSASSLSTAAAPPPGWYADPSGSSDRRWWDGERWTDDVGGASAQAPSPAPSSVAPAGGSGRFPSRPAAVLALIAIALALVAALVAFRSSSSSSAKKTATGRSAQPTASTSATLPNAQSSVAPTPTPAPTPTSAARPATTDLSGTYDYTLGFPPGCSTAPPHKGTASVVVDASRTSVTFNFNTGAGDLVDVLDGLSFNRPDPTPGDNFAGSFDISGPTPTFHGEGGFERPCNIQVIDGTKVS